MRPLERVPADPAALLPALRDALAGGPAVVAAADGDDGLLPDAVPDRTAVVVRTSGTSGAPKAVALSAEALHASAAATATALGGAGSWVLALPVHRVAGLQVLVRGIVAGTEPVLPAPGSFRPTAFAAAVRAMPAGRRYASLVPAQVHRLVEAAGRDAEVHAAMGLLHAVLVGGGRLAPDLRDRALAAGLPVVRTYGASETAGGCVYDGRPLPGVGVEVVDGEVRLAGPMLAEGYLDEPERSAVSFVDDGGTRWYRTGDAGEWDGARLEVTGRFDDVVISGGEKVSLGRVEQVVQALPGLGEAVVVRTSDPEWGEVPVLAAVGPVDLPAVRAAVAARLGRAAAPRRVLLLDELPLLPSGKPDRRLLTALADARRQDTARGSAP